MKTMKPISAKANRAAMMKRIFVLGTTLDGAFQRVKIITSDHGALIRAGQINKKGAVERASAMVSYMTRRGSAVSILCALTPLSKQRGQICRPSTSRSQSEHRNRPHSSQTFAARLCA